jgi:hypothetical protein
MCFNWSFILFFSFLPLVGFAQRDGSKVMDVNNIDYRLLDSLIIVEVNKVRDSLGHFHMNYSRVVSDNISKRTCDIMFKEQHVYHPDGREDLLTEKLESKVIEESAKTYGFTGGNNFNDTYEICLFTYKTFKMVTYGDIVKNIVDLWETSPDHCFVIRDAYKNDKSRSGADIILMSGVSTKYGKWNERNGFYAVLNLTVVYRYK